MVINKILIISVVLVLIISGGIVYLDRVVLQKNVRTVVIEGLEKATGKTVVVQSVRFSIFKGLVLRDIIISENNIALINSKEVSCSFLIQPLFKKQIIIPSITIRSPEIFLERKPDNSINLIELFTKNNISKNGFNLVVRKISIKNASVNFHDATLTPPFTKKIDKFNLNAYFALPAKVRFDFGFGIPGDPLVKITSSGEYDIIKKEFRANMNVKDLPPGELKRYYEKLDFAILEGRCDTAANLILKGNTLIAYLNSQVKGLVLSKDKMTARMDSDIKADVKYGFDDKQLTYSGNVSTHDLTLAGIGTIDEINKVEGDFAFNNSGISADNITAEILDLPVKAKFALTDFSSPAIKTDISANIDLAEFQNILKDMFEITVPADLSGRGKLYVVFEDAFPQMDSPHVGGFLEVSGAKIIFDTKASALEELKGKINFTNNQVTWSGLSLKYRGTSYRTSGMLTNFSSPGVQLKLSSKDIALESVFGINDKVITFSKLAGTYFDSKFSLEGEVDLSDKTSTRVNLDGTADIDLASLKEPLKNFKDSLDKIKPSGVVHSEFTLRGPINDLRSCDIEAKLSSASISLYDLKTSDIFMNYRQKKGIAEIPFMHANLYGGTMDVTAKIDLIPKDTPYSLTTDIKDMKIEQMKLDTPFKDKNIAGTIYLKSKFTGYSNDLSRLSGSGMISVSNGKLWQLNLFQGLGVLLFTSDFSNIIFKEGMCDFVVGNKEFYTEAVTLKSDLVNFYGPVKIDFHDPVKTIKSELKVEIKEGALAAGAKKNITTAIGKYSFIEIAGTLKDPKYKLKADMDGIMEDIADKFFAQ